MSRPTASAERRGDTLALTGMLVRDAVVGLWPRLGSAVDGATRIDLHAVEAVDSAGVALVAELAERLGATAIDGAPPGWNELCDAYRLDFAGASADAAGGT